DARLLRRIACTHRSSCGVSDETKRERLPLSEREVEWLGATQRQRVACIEEGPVRTCERLDEERRVRATWLPWLQAVEQPFLLRVTRSPPERAVQLVRGGKVAPDGRVAGVE